MMDDGEEPFELEIVTLSKSNGLYVVWQEATGTISTLGPYMSIDAAELSVIQVIEGFSKALGRTVVVKRASDAGST